jgi:short subunit dehydrogenase-like uncharacterized protein
MSGDFLLYGATGYLGSAIAGLAVERGLHPILGGRNAEAIGRRGAELGLETVITPVSDPAGLDAAMTGVPVVLNCAGPFVHTAIPVIESCLRTGTHYLDLSGEPVVYEVVAARDDRAVELGVMLLPSVGFDVVPTDCLAAHLARRLPSATRLTLALNQQGPAGLPPGTLNSLIEMLPYGSNKQHRVDGAVVDAGSRERRSIDFGEGPVEAVLLTWGDVFTAYRSTGIPNIEDFFVLDDALIRQLDSLDRSRSLFRLPWIRAAAKRGLKGGATAAERAQTTMTVWGEVTDDAGGRAASRLFGPEGGLEWTSRVALDVVGHVLAGDVTPGFQTPATAYGPDLVLETEGVRREDVE